MEAKTQPNIFKSKRISKNVFFLSFVLIAAGVIITGKQFGFLSEYLYSIFISWPMALVVAGIWSLFNKHLNSGMFTIAIGSFLLIPLVVAESSMWYKTYWPWLLVIGGVFVIFHFIFPFRNKYDEQCTIDDDYYEEDGYVIAENEFGKLKKIVLDKVFRGADIKNNFGGTVLDLRKSSLETGQTYIDIDSSFGGIELWVPSNWVVECELNPSISSVQDKRYRITANRDLNRKLIIRGNLSFSGIEIKG